MVTLVCEACDDEFKVKWYRRESARFCSRRCNASWHCKRRLAHAPKPWASRNGFRPGNIPAHTYPKGHEPWNKGRKGLHLSPATEFKDGHTKRAHSPVGTTRIRKDKAGNLRAWIKCEDKSWLPRAQLVWTKVHGAIPDGSVVHHIDRDSLNDDIWNLELVTRAEHWKIHQDERERARDQALGRSGS